ncbi:MAG TPA: metallophosphoesterase, partial [Kofleriaceae bacterium]
LEHEPEQWPWPVAPTRDHLVDGVRRLLFDIAQHGPRTVVWCGDEVDSGDPAEWRQWRTAVDAVPDLAHRVVPGNHDICFNRPFDEDYDLARRALRERAFQRHAGSLAEFPFVDTIIGDAGPITTVLLDSCRHRSTHVLSNAIGYFGDDQLASLAATLERTRGAVLCIAHHHVWRDETFMQPDEWYNTAVDADALAAILQRYRHRDPRNQVLVCHGHRHVLTPGWIGDPRAPIAVVGLPSSTLGDKAGTGRLDGILRYGIAGLRSDGSWAVALRELGPLIPTRTPARDERPPR